MKWSIYILGVLPDAKTVKFETEIHPRKYAKTRKVDRTLLPPLPDTKEAREAEERLYLDQEKVLKQAGTLLRYGIVLLSPLPRVQYPGPEQIGDGYNVDVHIFLVHPWDVQIRQVGNDPEYIINMHDVAPIEHCVGPWGFLKESSLTMIKNEIIRAACKAFWAPSLVRTDHFEGRWRWGHALTARSEAGEYSVREDNIDIIRESLINSHGHGWIWHFYLAEIWADESGWMETKSVRPDLFPPRAPPPEREFSLASRALVNS